jgi:hypothetical protein
MYKKGKDGECVKLDISRMFKQAPNTQKKKGQIHTGTKREK